MMKTPASFEETFPRYPFAELVRLSIALSRLFQSSRQATLSAVSRVLPA